MTLQNKSLLIRFLFWNVSLHISCSGEITNTDTETGSAYFDHKTIHARF